MGDELNPCSMCLAPMSKEVKEGEGVRVSGGRSRLSHGSAELSHTSPGSRHPAGENERSSALAVGLFWRINNNWVLVNNRQWWAQCNLDPLTNVIVEKQHVKMLGNPEK
jgi:hypothetical protein